MKNPLTPAGIEPATFQFVAQHLNHCATAAPYLNMHICKKGKVIPLQARSGPDGSRKLRFLYFMTIGTGWW